MEKEQENKSRTEQVKDSLRPKSAVRNSPNSTQVVQQQQVSEWFSITGRLLNDYKSSLERPFLIYIGELVVNHKLLLENSELLEEALNSRKKIDKLLEQIKMAQRESSKGITDVELQRLRQKVFDHIYSKEFKNEVNTRAQQYANSLKEERLKRAESKKEEETKNTQEEIRALSSEISIANTQLAKDKKNYRAKKNDKNKNKQKEAEKNLANLKAKKEILESKLEDIVKELTNAEQFSEKESHKDFTNKKLVYEEFLNKTEYHALSFKALDLVDNNIEKAKNMIDQIKAFPEVDKQINEKVTNLKLWQEATDTLGSAITASLLGRISLKQLKSFTAIPQGLSLLKDLYVQADTDNLDLQQVAVHLGSFEPYIQNDKARALLIPLLASQKAEDLKLLFEVIKMIPGNTDPAELITTLLPFVKDANALLVGLQYVKEIGLDQEQMTAIIKSVEYGSDAEAIKNKINETALSVINKDKNNGEKFKQWMKVLDRLIAHANFTIEIGELRTLSGGNTDERHCYVNSKRDRANRFEIHYHPKAVKPTPDNPNASKIHIKPNPGDKHTNRIFDNELKNPIFGYDHIYEQLKDFLKIEGHKNSS